MALFSCRLAPRLCSQILCSAALFGGLAAGIAFAKAPQLSSQSWTWFAGADFGIRTDSGGDGGFRADRGGRIHKGVDFLMPVGTPLFAPCSGSGEVGYDDGGYGNYVVVI